MNNKLKELIQTFNADQLLSQWKRVSPGSAPGTLQDLGSLPDSKISLLKYSADDIEEINLKNISEIHNHFDSNKIHWIDIAGLGTIDIVKELGEKFSFHRLDLEDIQDFTQRIKIQSHDEYTFIIAKHLELNESLFVEQVNIILAQNWVMTLSPIRSDFLDPVRNRIREGLGQIRKNGSDYLCYAILDNLIDSHFVVIDRVNELVEEMEVSVFGQQDSPEILAGKIRETRLVLSYCKKWITPMKEVLKKILDGQCSLIQKKTRVYFSDCQDHILQQIDSLNSLRDETSDLMNLQVSMVSQKMNEIMKVLTIISTIFMPLGFVAGCYGMNFNTAVSPFNMPELNHKYGYPLTLSLMGLIAFLLIIFFYRKGWLGK